MYMRVKVGRLGRLGSSLVSLGNSLPYFPKHK